MRRASLSLVTRKFLNNIFINQFKNLTDMEKIVGLIDAPFTPFYENGEVNLEPIEAYAAMLASRCQLAISDRNFILTRRISSSVMSSPSNSSSAALMLSVSLLVK